MPYQAPIDELRFVLRHVVGFDAVTATARFADAGPETQDAILTGAGRLAAEVLAPLNRVGDTDPARLEGGIVRTPPGFAQAYRAIAEGGWIGLAANPAHGGMGLPQTLATAVNEMFSSACLALGINPLMTQGQIEALEHHAGADLRALYLPRLISGDWCATMNLTEPQAGSDVGALRCRAEPAEGGAFAISGQKIYISWADNDFTANVCHLVLARLPDGGPGTRGISLFMVPKFIPDAAGRPGARNGLRVLSLEEKTGLHGSPTAVMEYDGALGWLVGEPHRGMAAMFTMMNNARLGVGVQGVGIAEAALQMARAHALLRRQGATPVGDGSGPIADHADVRRMLGVMAAETAAARAVALGCAVAIDMARATGDAGWQARASFLTPIAKVCGTEAGIAVADLGIQVHGGMGYVAQTGAAQLWRDIRVSAIYEGTNGIQAMDLVGRKLADGGAAARALIAEVAAGAEAARPALPGLARALAQAAAAQGAATQAMLGLGPTDRAAGALAYLRGFARLLGAHYLLRGALAEGGAGQRRALAEFFAARLLPQQGAHLAEAVLGAEGVYALGVAGPGG
ncbi:MAG: acyl-CoA dehydrogenase family protein [Gemmobacter sp.]